MLPSLQIGHYCFDEVAYSIDFERAGLPTETDMSSWYLDLQTHTRTQDPSAAGVASMADLDLKVHLVIHI